MTLLTEFIQSVKAMIDRPIALCGAWKRLFFGLLNSGADTNKIRGVAFRESGCDSAAIDSSVAAPAQVTPYNVCRIHPHPLCRSLSSKSLRPSRAGAHGTCHGISIYTSQTTKHFRKKYVTPALRAIIL